MKEGDKGLRTFYQTGACWKLGAGNAARGDDSGEIESSGRRAAWRTLLLSQAASTYRHTATTVSCTHAGMFCYSNVNTKRAQSLFKTLFNSKPFFTFWAGSVSLFFCLLTAVVKG